MHPARLPFTMILFLFAVGTSYGQTASIQSFDVSAAPAPGGTNSEVTFVLSVSNPSSIDSLSFKMTDGDTHLLYSSGNTVAGWKSQVPYREEEGMLYLTVPAGTYSAAAAFNSAVYLKGTDGEVLSYTRP